MASLVYPIPLDLARVHETPPQSAGAKFPGQAELRLFLVKRQQRARSRRSSWSSILLIHALGLLVLKGILAVGFGDLYRGLNLRLPWLTKLALDPRLSLLIALLIGAALLLRFRHREESLEDEVEHCWL